MDTKSPSPAVSDTPSKKIEQAFWGIEHTLCLILNRIEKLKSKDAHRSQPKTSPPAEKSSSPLPIPAALKGKGRAEPAIPIPSTIPTTAHTTAKPVTATKEQTETQNEDFPPLPAAAVLARGIQQPLFMSIVASGPTDGFQKVQRKTKPVQPVATRFVHAGSQSSTEITISCTEDFGGMEEELFQWSTLVESIIREAQAELNKVSVSAPHIIKGHFSTCVATNGNFIFMVQGQFSPKEIQGFEGSLCAPFPGASIVVPADGWIFAHLRSILTTDGRGNIWSHDDLFNTLEENTCFQGICLMVAPCWLHDSYVTSLMEKSTVTFAYVDDENTVRGFDMWCAPRSSVWECCCEYRVCVSMTDIV